MDNIQIEKLSTFGLDTVSKPDGYYQKSLPEATCDNMLAYMEKINQLVEEVNRLKEIINHIKQI